MRFNYFFDDKNCAIENLSLTMGFLAINGSINGGNTQQIYSSVNRETVDIVPKWDEQIVCFQVGIPGEYSVI